jgi:hypothetical protein
MTSDLAPGEPGTNSIRVWAVGTGTWDRDYFEDTFEKYGVALVGCDGVPRRYTPELEENREFRALGRNRKSSIRTIATKMKRGDLVIARRGRSLALGLGVVRGEYDYQEEWAEVQGWDLYHQVRVEWLEIDGFGDREEKKKFKDPQGRTLTPFASTYVVHEVRDRSARDWALENGKARALEVTASEEDLSDLPELPTDRARLKNNETPAWFKKAEKTFKELTEAWDWKVSESSIVAHLLVPMLMDLGWDRTQIKLEKHWMDVLVEDSEGSPALLIEAKAPRFGVSAARRQALDYWKKGRGEGWWDDVDPWLLATNGISFLLEKPEDPDSRFEANLRMPTEGAKEFIRAFQNMAPR